MSKTTSGSLAHVLNTLWKQYNASASSKVKVVDVYGAFCIATAVILHGYMSVLGSFPFNSYLAALFTCIGGGVLAGCLRMQLDTTNKDFRALAPERAYADFILAHLVLLFIAWNYIG
eukprot:jgi/Ulvmu1/237/UM001_0241.1